MKTKIVYVVASKESDIYFEQAVVSAWSCRNYNQDCEIVLVCDQDTEESIRQNGNRQKHCDLFDKILVQRFEEKQTMKERSRWMKTALREIVEGDFLYIDTDTIVCQDLSFVDNYTFNVGFVLDINADLQDTKLNAHIYDRVNRLYGFDYSSELNYYNSGVSFVKDTEPAHRLFSHWHELWKEHRYEKDGMFDQGALNVANAKLGYVVTEMSGDMNCQVTLSIQYLHTASIVHFFNIFSVAGQLLNPFFGREIYLQVKKDGLTDDIKQKILNCKSEFVSPSVLVPAEASQMWREYCRDSETLLTKTNSYNFLSYLKCVHPKAFHFLERVLGKIINYRK